MLRFNGRYFILFTFSSGFVSVMLLYNEFPALRRILRQDLNGTGCSGLGDENAAVWSSEEVEPNGKHGKIQFLKKYRNPCWYEWTRDQHARSLQSRDCFERLRCLPYFMIIGQPKCATTDIFNRLSLHPQVRTGATKGLHWWSRKRYGGVSFSTYVSFFDKAAEAIHNATIPPNDDYRNDTIIGEASTSLFWDASKVPAPSYDEKTKLFKQKIAADIKYFLPTVKLIVILRDPVDRLYSDYHFLHKNETKSPQEFHKLASDAVKTFNNCTRHFMESFCVHDKEMKNKFKVRFQVGVYSIFLKEWLQVFPREQILVINFERYISNMKYHLANIFNFLHLRELTNEEESDIVSRSPINVNRDARRNYNMFTETRHLLENFYARFNQELAELLNDDRFLWKRHRDSR